MSTNPTDAERKPFGYFVYVLAEQRGEFVHDLDDAVDDLTNCECEVTPLYDALTASPPSAEMAAGEPVAWQARMKGSYGWSGWYNIEPGGGRLPKIGKTLYEYRPLFASPLPAQQPAQEGAFTSEQQRQLAKFYAASDIHQLIAEMERHILRLQEKLPRPPSLAPQRVREG